MTENQHVMDAVKRVGESQERLAEAVEEILVILRGTAFNPEEGLQSRVRDIEMELGAQRKAIEEKRRTDSEGNAKKFAILMAVVTGILGSIGMSLWTLVKGVGK